MSDHPIVTPGTIAAIDPGTEESAIVTRSPAGDYSGWILPNFDLLLMLRTQPLDVVVIEEIESYGMAVGRTVFQTVHWAGRFYEALDNGPSACPRRLPRKEVKLVLCRDTRAKDMNVRAALIDRFGGSREKAVGRKAQPGPLYGFKSHMWAALGVLEAYRELYYLDALQSPPTNT